MTDRRYSRPLEDLERAAHVRVDDQVQEQDVSPPRQYVDPEDADRLRLLNDPAGGGTLRPRR